MTTYIIRMSRLALAARHKLGLLLSLGACVFCVSCDYETESHKKGKVVSDYPVPVIVISEAQRNRYLETGYKPLSGNFDKKKFDEEYTNVRVQVKAAVEKHWKYYSPGECLLAMDKDLSEVDLSEIDFDSLPEEEGDFFINDDYWYFDRFMPIEVLEERILTPKLLRVVHEAVSNIESDYSIDICDARTVLKTKDGDFYPRFNIFIEKKQILIYSESEDLFEKLGISYSPKEED
ncbi:MAG: hypothetical protein JXM70_20160 [Pirellulales bacterium]|nr:hypothetical protein [Pirellulales bacterium]